MNIKILFSIFFPFQAPSKAKELNRNTTLMSSKKLKLNQNESSILGNIEKVSESDINALEESGIDSSVNELALELIHGNDNLS